MPTTRSTAPTTKPGAGERVSRVPSVSDRCSSHDSARLGSTARTLRDVTSRVIAGATVYATTSDATTAPRYESAIGGMNAPVTPVSTRIGMSTTSAITVP